MAKKTDEIRIVTVIGAETVISGDFKAVGSVRIDGVVEGKVSATETLILGATGAIHSDVDAKVVIAGGEINGNVKGSERVELTSTAKIIGDIETASIIIDENAIFQGGCNMYQDASSKRNRFYVTKAVKNQKKSSKEAVDAALKESQNTDIDELA